VGKKTKKFAQGKKIEKKFVQGQKFKKNICTRATEKNARRKFHTTHHFSNEQVEPLIFKIHTLLTLACVIKTGQADIAVLQ